MVKVKTHLRRKKHGKSVVRSHRRRTKARRKMTYETYERVWDPEYKQFILARRIIGRSHA